MRSIASALFALTLVAAPAAGLEITDQVVFHEIYYYVPGFDAHNEYLEIMNAGSDVAYLDGAVITDEGDEGMPEGVFKFPGEPGGAEIPILPGEILLIAVDAVPGELEPDLSIADWEFFHAADDNNNPSVPDVVECSGSNVDMALANEGDGLILATGADTSAAIDCGTVVDGVNWDEVPDPVPISASVCVDPEYAPGSPQGNCLGRCPGGLDSDESSAEDWYVMIPTPGEDNLPMHPDHCGTAVPEEPRSFGTIKALFR